MRPKTRAGCIGSAETLLAEVRAALAEPGPVPESDYIAQIRILDRTSHALGERIAELSAAKLAVLRKAAEPFVEFADRMKDGPDYSYMDDRVKDWLGVSLRSIAMAEIERIERKPVEQIRGSLARKADADLVTTVPTSDRHAFESVGGDFPDTCRLCACFRESIQHQKPVEGGR